MGAGVMRLVHAYDDAGLRDVTVKLYPGGRHEMLHETNKDEVVADLCAWVEATYQRLS
jgi:alpha-beta hydrolase superfamily lysophospholipase